VFTEPLSRNVRLFVRLLHSDGCTCYSIMCRKPLVCPKTQHNTSASIAHIQILSLEREECVLKYKQISRSTPVSTALVRLWKDHKDRSQARNQHEASSKHSLFFGPEDVGDIFLRNVWLTFNGLHGFMSIP
jgi:hypothetical protein